MRKGLLFILLTPFLGFSQYDFETRYFQIDAKTLTEVPKKTAFNLKSKAITPKKTLHFAKFLKITPSTYWQSINMSSALSEELPNYKKKYQESIHYPKIKAKKFGFSFNGTNTNSTNSEANRYGIKNIAYKESRGLFICSPSGNY